MSNLQLAKTHKEFKLWENHFLIDWHYAQSTVLDSSALKKQFFIFILIFILNFASFKIKILLP